jgi:hypothetical protein
MQKRIAILEGLAKGEQAIAEGLTFSSTQAKARMSKWLK